MEANSKVILLPSGKQLESYKILRAPDSQDLGKTVPILLDLEGGIYLVGEIKGDSASKRNIQLKSGGAVKSYLIENCDGNGAGFVLQDPSTIITNVFDPTFLLISILHSNADLFSKRFITYEDLCDQVSSKYGSWIHEIARALTMTCLDRICETITEGDDTFYKYAQGKAASFVHERVNKVKNYFESHPNLSIHSNIRENIVPPHQQLCDVPAAVTELAILRCALDIVCDSYLVPEFKTLVIKEFGYDFGALDTHISNIREALKNLLIVEENMNALASSGNNKSTKKATAATKTKKSAVKKVVVGKGALDGFFKRA